MKTNKKQLRQNMAEHLPSYPAPWVREGNTAITQRLLELEEYKKAKTILAYLHMKQEISLDGFIEEALKEGKTVFVPKCLSIQEGMTAVQLKSLADAVPTGPYQIREPKEVSVTIEEKDLDLLFIPGVAFDRCGHRLGHGAGYYDRFLSTASKGRYIGICWDLQCVPTVPVEPHDIPMDMIVTERCVYRVREDRRKNECEQKA